MIGAALLLTESGPGALVVLGSTGRPSVVRPALTRIRPLPEPEFAIAS